MARSYIAGVLFVALLGVTVGTEARGQGILDDLYGQGVHAYFEGDYDASAQWLSQAIAQGTQDPRAYYYRGLAHLKLGDESAANDDFAAGAAIEATGTSQFYPIADSLARVQGAARVKIETARKVARVDAVEAERERQKARYEQVVQAEARVLRGASQSSDSAVEVDLSAAPATNLPFPQVAADTEAETGFDVLGTEGLGNVGVEPVSPVAVTEGETVEEPEDPFGDVGVEVDGGVVEAGGSPAVNVLSGLFRAVLSPAFKVAGPIADLVPANPAFPGGGEEVPFEFDVEETEVGDDIFGTGVDEAADEGEEGAEESSEVDPDDDPFGTGN